MKKLKNLLEVRDLNEIERHVNWNGKGCTKLEVGSNSFNLSDIVE